MDAALYRALDGRVGRDESRADIGLRKIDANAGVIILQSEPLFSLLLSTIFLRERPSRRQLIATSVILIGIGSVFGTGRAFTPFGLPRCSFSRHFLANLARHFARRDAAAFRDLRDRSAHDFRGGGLTMIFIVSDLGAVRALADPRTLAVIFVTGAFVYVLGFADVVRRNQPSLARVDHCAHDSGRANAVVSFRDRFPRRASERARGAWHVDRGRRVLVSCSARTPAASMAMSKAAEAVHPPLT